jgi:hypothetical protein
MLHYELADATECESSEQTYCRASASIGNDEDIYSSPHLVVHAREANHNMSFLGL